MEVGVELEYHILVRNVEQGFVTWRRIWLPDRRGFSDRESSEDWTSCGIEIDKIMRLDQDDRND